MVSRKRIHSFETVSSWTLSARMAKFYVIVFLATIVKVCYGQESSTTPLPGGQNIVKLNENAGEMEGRVFNGYNAKLGDFKWITLLNAIQPDNLSFTLCGGSIITRYWILTAAHCVENEDNIMVYMGLVDSTTKRTATQQKVSKVVIHPDYNSTYLYNDIALLKLPQQIVYTPYIQPISLPGSAAQDASYWDDKPANVSGWGKTYSLETTEHRILQYRELDIKKYTECSSYYSNYPYTEKNLCTDKTLFKWAGPCQGDSGGPLAYGNTLAGIVSWGVGNCENFNPSVYTNVGSHLGWIYSTLWFQ